MAANQKLSSQDKKDLDKFTKYLVYKCIQIIVQSRLGERVKTQSRPFSTGADWFNLVIKDLPDVLTETKKVVSSGYLKAGQHVCVEISLKTSEGESMVLETWSLSMSDQKDPYARVFYTVYNRMSLMLKSLFCLTRATPAYRLSRKQGLETYVMCYRIYSTSPETNLLGSGYETKTVGKVPTPEGTIHLSVNYRTKMLISPNSSKELVENLKDDHFTLETSPTRCHTIPKLCQLQREERVYTEEGFTMGDSEFSASSFGTSPPDAYFMQAQSPRGQQSFSQSRQHSSDHLNGGKVQMNGRRSPLVVKSRQLHNGAGTAKSGNKMNGVKQQNGTKISLDEIGAFVSDGESDDETDGKCNQKSSTKLPFVELVENMSNMQIDKNANQMQPATSPLTNGTVNGNHNQMNGIQNNVTSSPSRIKGQLQRNRHTSGESGNCSPNSTADDYVMIDMKCALTEIDDNPELGRFYRDCKDAPDLTMFHAEAHARNGEISHVASSPLATFDPSSPLEDIMDDHMLFNSITDQLLQFEAQGHEFDDFVNSLSTAEA